MSDLTVDLTVDDVAYILGVGRATVYYKQRTGALPGGSGIDLAKAAIRIEEDRIEHMRQRLAEKVTQRLVVAP